MHQLASLSALVSFSVDPYHSVFSMACEGAHLFIAVLEAKWLISQTFKSSFLPPDAAFFSTLCHMALSTGRSCSGDWCSPS